MNLSENHLLMAFFSFVFRWLLVMIAGRYGDRYENLKDCGKTIIVVGALVYLVGLWISCPLLSEKAIFLAC